MKIRLFTIVLITLLCSFSEHITIKGKVIRVIDGDTVVVLTAKNEQVKVRLEGIDCPEKDQDYGTQAKKATSDLCFGKIVRVMQSGTDRYGRALGFVYVDETNVCVNEELLKRGLAWHYKKYNQDWELAQMEKTAKQNKIGIWSMKNPIAPWDWRRM